MQNSHAIAPWRAGCWFLVLAAVEAGLHAQFDAELVADIGQTVPQLEENLAPFALLGRGWGPAAELGGRVYFYANDGLHGVELWVSDGTGPGTRLFRDLCSGFCGSLSGLLDGSLARLGSRVLFAANDGVHGQELWTTQGTAGTTQLFADLLPGLLGSFPRQFVVVGSRMFFLAGVTAESERVWVTNGTLLGTQPLLPVTRYHAAVALAGRLVFAGSVGANSGLFSTDGTPGGLVQLLASTGVAPGGVSGLGYGDPFLVSNGKLYFSVRPDPQQPERRLWVSDGTVGGTFELPGIVNPAGLHDCQGTVYVHASFGEIWRTQGTAATTQQVPLPPGAVASVSATASACAGNRFLFPAGSLATGMEPWVVAGGVATLLADLRPGPAGSMDASGSFQGLIPLAKSAGSRVVFFANDGVHGFEPWATDGTPGGTELLADTNPGAGSFLAFPQQDRWRLPQLGSALLFFERTEEGVSRLWKTDGTSGGSGYLGEIETATSIHSPHWLGDFPPGLFSLQLVPFGAGVALAAQDGSSGAELWVTDGTPGGTEEVELVAGPAGSDPQLLGAQHDRLLFVYRTGGVSPQSRLAGLDRISQVVSTLHEAQNLGTPDPRRSRAFVGEEALVAVGTLLRTDGTPAGTSLLPEQGAPLVTEVVRSPAGLFAASPGLWWLDLDANTAVPVDEEDAPSLISLTPIQGGVVGVGDDGEGWVSDGSPEGTFRFHELPGPAGAFDFAVGMALDEGERQFLVPIGNRVFFPARDLSGDIELWQADGSGSSQVADLFPGPYPSAPQQLTSIGPLLFFVAEHPTAGRELWVLPPGSTTPQVLDLSPGAVSSLPQQLTAIRDELWFSAWTPGFGREPYRLRRGPAGWVVERAADLAPGPESSSPLGFVASGRWVYTIAQDGVHGFELWRLADANLLFADDFETSATAHWSSQVP